MIKMIRIAQLKRRARLVYLKYRKELDELSGNLWKKSIGRRCLHCRYGEFNRDLASSFKRLMEETFGTN